jgi:hypothetical protein
MELLDFPDFGTSTGVKDDEAYHLRGKLANYCMQTPAVSMEAFTKVQMLFAHKKRNRLALQTILDKCSQSAETMFHFY